MTAPAFQDYLDNHEIDWARLGRAVSYYKQAGFTYVEVPWAAPKYVVQVTLPLAAKATSLAYPPLDLVGSAEQSFLWLEKLGHLRGFNTRLFVGVSPCWRSDNRSGIHQKTFMKVELFARLDNQYVAKDAMVKILMNRASEFFKIEGAMPNVVPTTEGADLYVNGIEVGSYGHRAIGDSAWAYGTGLAEPRFSQAITKTIGDA